MNIKLWSNYTVYKRLTLDSKIQMGFMKKPKQNKKWNETKQTGFMKAVVKRAEVAILTVQHLISHYMQKNNNSKQVRPNVRSKTIRLVIR